jgi:transposase
LQFQYDAADSQSSIQFIDALRHEFAGSIILLWDGLPAHKSKLVKEHIAKQDWLTVERFPAYAPELNPVEYLWSAIKNKHMANVCDDTIAQIEKRIHNAQEQYAADTKTMQGFLKASTLYSKDVTTQPTPRRVKAQGSMSVLCRIV